MKSNRFVTAVLLFVALVGGGTAISAWLGGTESSTGTIVGPPTSPPVIDAPRAR